MIDLIFVLFIIYIIYQVVFNFIVPVSKTASEVRNKMYEMNNQQAPKNDNTTQQKASAKQPASATSKHRDDYIDFEEVK